jgi:hypothetical protein
LLHPERIDLDHATRTHAGRDATRRELAISQGAQMVLAFGWEPLRKGIDLALEAFASLSTRGDGEIVLVVVGTDLLEAFLRERFGAAFPGWLRFLRPREHVADLYAAADAFLSASRAEGFPYELGEALANGVPTVLTDIPGCEWAREIEGTRFFPSGDATALTDAIADVVRWTPERRAVFGRKGRALAAARLSLRAWAARVAGLYQHALAEARTGKLNRRQTEPEKARWSRRRARLRIAHRQLHHETSAPGAGVVEVDPTAVLLDDPVARRQTETHPLLALGGEEGLEQVRPGVRRDSRAVVGYLEPRPSVRGAGADAHGAGLVDRLESVGDQVQDHLVDLSAPQEQRGNVPVSCFDADGSGQVAGDELHRPAHALVEIGSLGVRFLAADEPPQVLLDGADPARRRPDAIDDVADVLARESDIVALEDRGSARRLLQVAERSGECAHVTLQRLHFVAFVVVGFF